MTDTTQTPNEAEEYAKALEAAGMMEPQVKDAPPPDPKPADLPADPPAQDTPAPADAGVSVSDEPFPGFAALSDEAKEAVKAKLAEADEARKQAAEYERRWKAQHGQLAPTQRELESTRRAAQEMQQRLRQIEEERAKAPPANDVLAKFREQYPDEAGALDAVSKQWESQAQALSHRNQQAEAKLAQLEAHVERQRAISTLSQRHPDWQEVDASEPFKAWVNALSPYKQAMAKSPDPGAVADVLDDFKRDMALAQALAGQHLPTPSTPKPGKKDVDPNPTTRQSLGTPASNAGSSEADEYVSALIAAGYQI